MKFVDLTVVSHKKISSKYYYLVLRSSEGLGEIKPGQFVMLGFPGRADVILPRPMGFFSVLENKNEYTVFSIGYVVIGKGTELIAGLREGDRLTGTGPLGNGWDLNFKEKTAVMVAGGIGITPLYMLTKELISAGKKPVLFYGAKTSSDLAFLSYFEELKIETALYTEDGSAGKRGLVCDGLPDEFREDSEIFACGPYAMLKAVFEECRSNGRDPQLSFDRRMACGFGVCLGCNLPVINEDGIARNVRVCKEGPVFRGSEVKW